MVSVQGDEAQTTPPFNAAKGDLLLAFVSSSGPEGPGMTMTVSGGGLVWTLVKRANGQSGVAEIWKATAATDLTGITVTSTPNGSTPSQSLVVLTFAGTGGVGASAAASGPLGGPSVSLTATKTGSFVYGVGNDWNGSVSRTVGTNQTIVHEFLGPNGDTFWVQRLNGTVPLIGTLITLNDSAPTDHSWNFAAVEIIPMQRVPPPITWPTPADIVYGTPLDDTQLNATTDSRRDLRLQPAGGHHPERRPEPDAVCHVHAREHDDDLRSGDGDRRAERAPRRRASSRGSTLRTSPTARRSAPRS